MKLQQRFKFHRECLSARKIRRNLFKPELFKGLKNLISHFFIFFLVYSQFYRFLSLYIYCIIFWVVLMVIWATFILYSGSGSEKIINVTYRLKTRVILREPGEHRTPDQAFSSLTSLLPYWVPVKPTSNSTMETIAQTKKIKSIQRQSSTKDGSVTVTCSLSDWIAKEASIILMLIDNN